jgi:broad-specificity NMP kinase
VGIAWITGNSGTGKSAVCAALAAEGYRSVDSDMGMAAWVNMITNDVIEAVDPGPLSREWFRDHRWLLRRSRVEELAEEAGTQTVFLCGLVQNDEDLWDLFDAKICLILDETTIRERIGRRSDNPFGKAPAELDAIVRINDLLGLAAR